MRMPTLAEWMNRMKEYSFDCDMLAVTKIIWKLGKDGMKVDELSILTAVEKQKIDAKITKETIKKLLQGGEIYDPKGDQNYKIVSIWEEDERELGIEGSRMKIEIVQKPKENRKRKHLLIVHFNIDSNFWLHSNPEDNIGLDLLKLVVKPDIIEQFKNDLHLSWTPRLDELKALNRAMEKVRKMNKEIKK